MSRQCDNWNELFKGVQRLKKHVEEAHKKGSGDGGGGGGGDDGGWIWQEAGGGVRGSGLHKLWTVLLS